MLELRLQARVDDAFPDGQTALMFCAASLMRITDTGWCTKLYLPMEALQKQDLEKQLAACATASSKKK